MTLPRSRSPIPRKTAPKRSGPPRKRNAKRKAREFARAYHSVERVEFVKEQPCAACGRLFGSENAHLLGNGGMGRKGPYTSVGPLCGDTDRAGCHSMFDQWRWEFDEAFPDFDTEAVAARTEAAWRLHRQSETT